MLLADVEDDVLRADSAGSTLTVFAARVINNGTLTVSPAPLSIVADDLSRVAGQPNPVFTGTVSGVKNGEAISATFDSSATPGSGGLARRQIIRGTTLISIAAGTGRPTLIRPRARASSGPFTRCSSLCRSRRNNKRLHKSARMPTARSS